MDRNQAIGIMLIALLLIAYFQFFPATTPEPETATEKTVTEAIPQEEPVEQEVILPDSLLDEADRQKFGVFAAGARGEGRETVIENEQLEITLSSQGGKVESVRLKQFTTHDGSPLYLLTPKSSNVINEVISSGRAIDLNTLYYTVNQSSVNDTTIVSFTLQLTNGGQVLQQYALPPSGYLMDYRIRIEGTPIQDDLRIDWTDNIIKQEADLELSRTNSTVNYYTSGGDFDGLAERSLSLESDQIDEPLKWVSIKQRFFVSALIAGDKFSNGEISTVADTQDTATVKQARVIVRLPSEAVTSGTSYAYYFGPNDYHVLKDVTEDFSKNLYLGWPPMIWVNKYVIIPLFDLLNNFIGNYGLIIIIMVLIIKLVLSPLSYKSYLSMAKMKVLKPEMDAIKEKHGDDMAAAQQETMKLYQQVGVNPVSGCIPMLLQMPILFAMFYFFPQSIELRGKSFLWANDLSNFDSILDLPFTIPFYGDHVSLFVLLMTGSTILYTWSNQQVSTVTGPMRTISYMMPLIFMFELNSYPAALSFYYFVSNLLTFGQQALIRKFVDDDKIKAILEENKKNAGNRKKSKFQQRLEAAMKAQEQQQQDKKKKKK